MQLLLDETTAASKHFLSFRYKLILSFYSIEGGSMRHRIGSFRSQILLIPLHQLGLGPNFFTYFGKNQVKWIDSWKLNEWGCLVVSGLNVVSPTFLLVFVKVEKRPLVKLRRISLQKLFSFSRKSKFRISDIQILWYHQIPKHKKRIHFTE